MKYYMQYNQESIYLFIYLLFYLFSLQYDPDDWKDISANAKDFIDHILVVNPDERMTAKQCLKHPFLLLSSLSTKESSVEISVEDKESSTLKYINKLSLFTYTHKLKRAALIVMADKLSGNELGELREKLRIYDKENSGFVSYLELTQAISELKLDDSIQDVYKRVNTMKINPSDKLNYMELIANSMERANYLTNERIQAAFTFLDNDNDGYITKIDLIRNGFGDNLSEYFKDVDDGSEKIDFEKFRITILDQEK